MIVEALLARRGVRRGLLQRALRMAGTAAFYGGVLLFGLYVLLPFSWMVISSFQTEAEIVSVPPHWLPERPTLENYLALFIGPQVGTGRLPEQGGFVPASARDLLPAMRNSAVVGSLVTLIDLVLGSMAGYAMARYRFPGRQAALYAMLALRIVPDIALMVPFFLLIRGLGLLDTIWALVVVYAGITLPFTVFIIAGYLETIPRELDDAALIDGCTPSQVLTRVLLPLAKPGLVAAAIFAFLASWNEFLVALVVTKTSRSLTLPVVVATFTSDFNISFALMNAAGVLAVVPPVVLAVLFHRYLVGGLTVGAVKE